MTNIETRFYEVADIHYPQNQAGGTGSVNVMVQPDGSLVVTLRDYGCDYNAPIINNREEVGTALGVKIQYRYR